MHWTYKIASILAVALITLAAGFYAQNNEETYPSGPSYDIGISDAHGQTLSTLTGLAATHHVVLARVSYEPDGHGTNRRVISIFGALDGNGMHANSPYPDYGFGPRTRVQRGDRFTDPLGRWLLYGSPRDTASVAKSIRRQGFELNRATPIGITQITKQFFSNSIAQVIFAGLAVVFVSGALSVSTASRVCAIQALHGMRTTGIIMRQFLRHAFFFIICVCIGWMTWISIGAIFWPFASPLGFAGQVFLSIIIATTCMALVALSLSIALVRVLVSNALKLIQGKRPLRFLMASGCIMAIIVLALSSASLNVTNFKWRQSQTLKTTLEHQLSSYDGFQLQLWYSSDQNRARSMPSWNDFVEQTSQSEHTRFASFRLGCTWVDSSQDPQPCILMDSRTARLHHLIRNNTTLARISVIMPENEQWNSESITNNVLRAYSFEQSLAAEEGKSLPAINRTSISIESRPRDAVLSAFDTPSNTDGLSSVPVVVIDPSLLSGDTTTSMVSTGGMTFDYSSRHQLLEILREKGVDSLVASVVNRHDEIQTRLARTAQEMNYFSITACISITCLLGGAIMVALTLCTLRRQIMFVEYMHGAPSYLRFQSILFLAAALCSASLPIQLLIGGYNAVSTTSVSLLFIVVSLATTVLYDSRLRADSIKHP